MSNTADQLLVLKRQGGDLDHVVTDLKELGYNVMTADTATAAETLANAQHIDLVLVDGQVEEGHDRETRGSFVNQMMLQDVPVVVLAVHDQMEQVAYFIDSGASDYLLEPFERAQLALRLKTNLAQKRLRAKEKAHLQNPELLKIEQDVQIARRIQAGFLPKALPQPDGWEIAARFHPAREVAGDFYDAFTLSQKRRVGFVIADVVDKGVPAALFMALVRSLTRAFAQQHYTLSWTDALEGKAKTRRKGPSRPLPSTGTIALRSAVVLTNDYILENHMDLNMFATLFFGMFDPRTGQLAYINAGHNPPFIVGADGAVKAKLKSSGPAVGMFPGIDYQIDYNQLDPGDTLFAYTDGVTEARAPSLEFFQEERLLELLAQPVHSAAEMTERVDSALTAFIADATPFDDITMMAVYRKPEDAN